MHLIHIEFTDCVSIQSQQQLPADNNRLSSTDIADYIWNIVPQFRLPTQLLWLSVWSLCNELLPRNYLI